MRYYFDLLDGSLCRDEEGVELLGLGTAKTQAVEILTSILPSAISDWPQVAVVVRDDEGHTYFRAVIRADIQIVREDANVELVWA